MTAVVVAFVLAPLASVVVRSVRVDGAWSTAYYSSARRPADDGVLGVPRPTALENVPARRRRRDAARGGARGGRRRAVTARGGSPALASAALGARRRLHAAARRLRGDGRLRPPRRARHPAARLARQPVAGARRPGAGRPAARRTPRRAGAPRRRPRHLREAAASLGAAPLRVLAASTCPRCGAPLLAAAGFAFAVSLGEFGATSFLARPDDPTLPVLVFQLVSRPAVRRTSARASLRRRPRAGHRAIVVVGRAAAAPGVGARRAGDLELERVTVRFGDVHRRRRRRPCPSPRARCSRSSARPAAASRRCSAGRRAASRSPRAASPRPAATSRCPAAPPRLRADVPGRPALPPPRRRRQRRLRPARTPAPAAERRGPGRRAARARRSDRVRRRACRRSSRAGRGSGSRWPAPSRPTRGCSCSTSRWRRSTAACASGSPTTCRHPAGGRHDRAAGHPRRRGGVRRRRPHGGPPGRSAGAGRWARRGVARPGRRRDRDVPRLRHGARPRPGRRAPRPAAAPEPRSSARAAPWPCGARHCGSTPEAGSRPRSRPSGRPPSCPAAVVVEGLDGLGELDAVAPSVAARPRRRAGRARPGRLPDGAPADGPDARRASGRVRTLTPRPAGTGLSRWRVMWAAP